MTGDPRQGATYYRLAEAARAAPTCHLCNRPMDHTLPPEHPAAPTADHLIPIGLGGHIHGTMIGAHRICNMRRRQQPITPALIERLSRLPLEWSTPASAGPPRRAPRHSQDW